MFDYNHSYFQYTIALMKKCSFLFVGNLFSQLHDIKYFYLMLIIYTIISFQGAIPIWYLQNDNPYWVI